MDPGDEIVVPLPITQGTVLQIPNGCTGSSLNSALSIKLSHSLTNRLFMFWSRTSLVAQINNTCHICLHYCFGLVKLLLDTLGLKMACSLRKTLLWSVEGAPKIYGDLWWSCTRSEQCHSQSQQQLLLNQECNSRRASLTVKQKKHSFALQSVSKM